MRQRFRRHHREQGQALVLVALAFVLLVAMLGLALDGANAFGQRRRVSNAADAASLVATRVLIEQHRISGTGTPINDAIDTYLSDRHDIDRAAVTWTAFYVERDARDVRLAPVENAVAVPTAADGVQVNVTFNFDTYFMGIFGQNQLVATSSGTSIFGPLGTAVGQDLAPLAVSVSAWETIKDEGTVRFDLKSELADDYAMRFPPEPLPDDVVTEANLAHVSFRDVTGAPVTGNDCGSTTPVETLTYWWCQGSPNRLRINRELPDGSVTYSLLSTAISWRINNRPLVVFPVYADTIRFEHGSPVPFLQLVNFVAMEVKSIDSDGVLTAELVQDYATSGAMVGDGSGVETGVWAVNLVR
jgi:Flp pilus assembly protein TadG